MYIYSVTRYKNDVLVLQERRTGRRRLYIGIRAALYNSSDVEMTAHVSADVPCTIRFKRAQQHEAIAAAVSYARVYHNNIIRRRYCYYYFFMKVRYDIISYCTRCTHTLDDVIIKALQPTT